MNFLGQGLLKWDGGGVGGVWSFKYDYNFCEDLSWVVRKEDSYNKVGCGFLFNRIKEFLLLILMVQNINDNDNNEIIFIEGSFILQRVCQVFRVLGILGREFGRIF